MTHPIPAATPANGPAAHGQRVVLFDRTGEPLFEVHRVAIVEAIRRGDGVLPDDIADLFALFVFDRTADGARVGRLDWA